MQAAARVTGDHVGRLGSICGAGKATKIYHSNPNRINRACFGISNALFYISVVS